MCPPLALRNYSFKIIIPNKDRIKKGSFRLRKKTMTTQEADTYLLDEPRKNLEAESKLRIKPSDKIFET